MHPAALTVSETEKNFRSTLRGLSAGEAVQRLHTYGRNALQEKKATPVWLQFLHQFRDFMILLLLIAAVLSGIMGDIADTLIILVIVVLNAVVGFLQEFRAGKAMAALKKLSITSAQVLRDEQVITVSSHDIVPGDMVLLEAGNIVPADIRLTEVHNLQVDESSLTGESVPVAKQTGVLPRQELQPGEASNMVFKGTMITSGRAQGMVVATGMQTELGKIAHLLQDGEALTPLQVRMEQFGRRLSYLILFICALLLITGILRGEEPFRLLLLSISLAVAAIPEALPALITIALSRGAARLAANHALVRKLPAVETLGAVTYICSDKTGTLTLNRMRVVDKLTPNPTDAAGAEMLHRCMALNHDIRFNHDQEPSGEATELALVKHVLETITPDAYRELCRQHQRLAELPFDADRRCMTTVHHYHGRYLIITKGASEAIAGTLLLPSEKNLLTAYTNRQAAEGKRVLAYAFLIVPRLPEPFTYKAVEKNLQFAGAVAMMDPPREEVKKAIAECRTAGIKPVMITGDHPATAVAIAKEIGLMQSNDLMLTGAELQQLDEARFQEQVEHVAVYARVSPAQKLRIVRALQSRHHFVSMTGDGVNDAPSLKAANIGVAMGLSGTDVSREAAHLVLLDDNFATIVKAIKEGRRIFDNIRKFVKYIMTCNSAEIWTIFLAPVFGMPLPLLPIHLLWINLVTDGLPALALSGEKAESDVMQRPPRGRDESLFSGGIGYHMLWVGLLMAGVTLGTQAWALKEELPHWQTMVFTVLSLSQLGHVMGVRSDRTFLWRQGLFSNRPLLGAVFLTFVLQLCAIYLPVMNRLLNTTPLTFQELGICIGVSMIVFHAVELEKWMKHLYRNKTAENQNHAPGEGPVVKTL